VAALDALSAQGREDVDLGAVIGREFDLAIVERVYPELDVLSGLDEASALVRPAQEASEVSRICWAV
jgi:hypothetical protein